MCPALQMHLEQIEDSDLGVLQVHRIPAMVDVDLYGSEEMHGEKREIVGRPALSWFRFMDEGEYSNSAGKRTLRC